MHRLSGEDAGFLYMEQPGQPMNTMAVALLQRGPEPIELDDVRHHLFARIDELPSFRWRVVPVPFGLHHPVCVDDPDFDLDFHLRTETLTGAGDDEELDALFASIAERHLDRRHPLWQVTLVNGLAGDAQALILKYHHCLADGVAAFTTFSRVFSDQVHPPLPGIGPFAPTSLPSRTRLVSDAIRDHARSIRTLPALVVRTRRRAALVRHRQDHASVAVPDFKNQAPWCVLNDAFTAPRAYVRASVPLAGARRIKDLAGVTLNDVVLGVVAGAMRRYLAERGGIPDRPLLASVPVSSEPPGAPTRQFGNQFWSFTTSLATDHADPWERLLTISKVTREAKEQLSILGAELVPEWLDRVPPFVAEPGARALVDRLRDNRDHTDVNIVVSNIRGPETPWEVLGTVVDDLYIDGPPSNGVGCNVMLWSYGDRLLFGVLAFADALQDPRAFGDAVHASFGELARAVDQNAAEQVVLADASPDRPPFAPSD